MGVQLPHVDNAILNRLLCDHAVLNQLIRELDVCSQQYDLSNTKQGIAFRRNQKRRRFRVDCKVRFFAAGESTVTVFPGRTRNISRRGLGLVVRRCFMMDEPLEVEINLPSHAPLFLCGQVRFCRYVGRGYHEVGVLLKAAGPDPVLSHDMTFAGRM